MLELASSELELDELVAEWIQSEFEDGTPIHLIGDASRPTSLRTIYPQKGPTVVEIVWNLA